MQSAAILAGGQATRFGNCDKSALIVGGQTILDRQLAELSTLTGDILIVGGEDGARGFPASAGVRTGPAMARLVEAPAARRRQPSDYDGKRGGPRRIVDLVPGCGPLGGLHAALTEARGDAVFVVACDMPYLSAPFIAYLLGLASDAEIVVPQTERGYHPLCAVYARTCLEKVTRALAERRLRMTELLAAARTRVVAAEDIERFGDRHRLLANVNTPAEYAGLEAIRRHKR